MPCQKPEPAVAGVAPIASRRSSRCAFLLQRGRRSTDKTDTHGQRLAELRGPARGSTLTSHDRLLRLRRGGLSAANPIQAAQTWFASFPRRVVMAGNRQAIATRLMKLGIPTTNSNIKTAYAETSSGSVWAATRDILRELVANRGLMVSSGTWNRQALAFGNRTSRKTRSRPCRSKDASDTSLLESRSRS